MAALRKKVQPRRLKGNVAIDKAVYDAIRRAILMGRLLPGTKLREPALARVLKVSRERVRQLEERAYRKLRALLMPAAANAN